MKKFSKSYVYYHLVVDFIIIFFIMLCFTTEMFLDSEEEFDFLTHLPEIITVFLVLFVIAYALKTLYSILYLNASGYQLKENEIECKRGVLFKKRSILDYKKIHAVNKKQNLIHKIFKLAVLTLDSGSTNTAYASEILIIEKENVVDEIVAVLKSKQSGETVSVEKPIEEKENLYKFTAKSRFIYSALNVLSTLLVLIVASLIAVVLFAVALPLITKNANGWETIGIILVALYSLIIYLIILLAVFVISILVSFLSYYKFRIFKNTDDVEINYGFFVKNNNTFKLNKIKGVIITQGLIKRLFGFVTVKVEVIGYNEVNSKENSSSTTGILFPLCKKSEVCENIKKVLPNFVPDQKQIGAKKYFPFISWKLLIFSIVAVSSFLITLFDLIYFNIQTDIILTVVRTFIGVYLITVTFILIGGLLAYKNNGISVNKDKITVYNGAFTKNQAVIKIKEIISIEDVTTPLRKRLGIYSGVIHFKSNSETNEVRINNVDESIIEKLKEIIKY